MVAGALDPRNTILIRPIRVLSRDKDSLSRMELAGKFFMVERSRKVERAIVCLGRVYFASRC